MYLIISGWNGCRSIIFLLEQKKRMSSVWFRESKNADIFRFETQDSTGLKKLKHNRWNRQFDNRLFNLRLDIFQWTKVINKNVNTLLCSRWSTGSGFLSLGSCNNHTKFWSQDLGKGFYCIVFLECVFQNLVECIRWDDGLKFILRFTQLCLKRKEKKRNTAGVKNEKKKTCSGNNGQWRLWFFSAKYFRWQD